MLPTCMCRTGNSCHSEIAKSAFFFGCPSLGNEKTLLMSKAPRIRSDRFRSDPFRADAAASAFRCGSLPPLLTADRNAKPLPPPSPNVSRDVHGEPYLLAITHRNNETLAHYTTSPAQTFDSYTWPDSLAPSRNITPIPLPRLTPVKKRVVVPVSSRVLRSAAKK